MPVSGTVVIARVDWTKGRGVLARRNSLKLAGTGVPRGSFPVLAYACDPLMLHSAKRPACQH
jgi:hypothetical protein